MQFDNTDFDFTATDEGNKPVVDGDYDGIIADDTDVCETRSGNAGIKVKVRLMEGPEGSLNRQLTDTVGYSQAAAFKVCQLADAAGVSRPTAINEEAAKSFAQSLRGQAIRVRVKNSMWGAAGTTPKNQTKIEGYLVAEGAPAVQLAAGGRRARR